MKLFGLRAPRRPSGLSVIGDRLTIRGEIDTDGTIRVDGRVEGGVHRAGMLIIGAGGGVVGDVEAGDVIVAGTIHGNVHATGRVEIEPGAAVHGEIRANNMLLREGAILHGQVSIGAAPVSTATPGASRRLELAQTPAHPARARV
ncbi:MAG: polymer-forming cytoskeletal protein [Gemmatimonadaceae bacterium]